MARIRLEGTGWHDAKPVRELKVGDVIEWNYGYKSTVLELRPTKTGKQIYVTLESRGTEHIRRMGAERLVAIG